MKFLSPEEVKQLQIKQAMDLSWSVPAGGLIELARRLKAELEQMRLEYSEEEYQKDYISSVALNRVFEKMQNEISQAHVGEGDQDNSRINLPSGR